MLYLKAIGGLCNRLRAIASAVELTKDCNDSLCVVWGRCSGMNESFTSIMQRPDTNSFSVVQEGDADFDKIACRFSPKSRNYYRQLNGKESQQREMQDNLILSKQRDEDSYIETCYHFYKKANYRWFRPNPELAAAVDTVQKRIGGPYIGVHIRRTDNIKSCVYSPLHLFEKAIREEMEKNGNARFFLATDDKSAKTRLTAMFGPVIFTRNDIAERYAKGGLADAVVDFILLSRASKLYGSYWSSFSDVAAEISGIPFVCVRETDPERIIANYHAMLANSAKAFNAKVAELSKEKKASLRLESTVAVQEKQIRNLKDEVNRLKTSEAYRIGMFVTWPARKAWGGVKCLRENGFKYTVKHTS